MSDVDTQHNAGHDEGYEKTDISVPKTVVVALFVIILIIGFVVVLNEYFIAVREDIVYEQQLSTVSQDLREARTHEAEMLHSYEVLNADSGTYRIPIERAMELMADEAFEQR